MSEFRVPAPKELATVSSPRLLTSVDDFVAYSLWKNDYCPENKDPVQYARRKILERKEEFGTLGAGNNYRNPAVYATFADGSIVSAGSIEVNYSTQSTKYDHLPPLTMYALMGDAHTNAEFRNLGFNSQITSARVAWAQERNLPWIKARVNKWNHPSLVTKLKSGFVIENAHTGLGGGVFDLILPLKNTVALQMGLQDSSKHHTGELLTPLQAADQSRRFETEYGVLERYDPSQGDVVIRMMPRELGSKSTR